MPSVSHGIIEVRYIINILLFEARLHMFFIFEVNKPEKQNIGDLVNG